MRSLRQALADAEDALADARAAVQGLREQVRTADPRQELRAMRVKDAALGVLRAEAAPVAAGVLAELVQAQETVARLGRVAEWLTGAGVIEAAGEARAAVARHQSAPCGWFRVPGATDPAAGWQAALDALQADPEAPAGVVARA